MSETIVLAYSGGLDTSVALRWLAEEYGAEALHADGFGIGALVLLAAEVSRRHDASPSNPLV